MAGMAVSTGLISGIDYDTMISQLMQVEANPQTLLKTSSPRRSPTPPPTARSTPGSTPCAPPQTPLTAASAWAATKADQLLRRPSPPRTAESAAAAR